MFLGHDFQRLLWKFRAECEAAGMRINSSKGLSMIYRQPTSSHVVGGLFMWETPPAALHVTARVSSQGFFSNIHRYFGYKALPQVEETSMWLSCF